MKNSGRILVVRGGAIGDFILTLPALTALRGMFPDTHIELLGYPHIARLALAGGIVDEVRSIEARALASFFVGRGMPDAVLSEYFSSFHIIVSYLYDPDELFQTNVRRNNRAQFIAGPHRPDESQAIAASAVFLKPLERLAIFDASVEPQLRLPHDPATALPPAPWIAVHPGSGSEKKNWPEARWAELLPRVLAATDARVLLVGGEAEGGKIHRLEKLLPPERVRTMFNVPLPELGRQLQQCRAFIGHDSGISHLASALGVPTLLLWGETSEAIWRPPGARNVVLKHSRGLADLSVNTVIEACLRFPAIAAYSRAVSVA
jgi:heptosyltransferase-2